MQFNVICMYFMACKWKKSSFSYKEKYQKSNVNMGGPYSSQNIFNSGIGGTSWISGGGFAQ